jgi:hypothetical protein
MKNGHARSARDIHSSRGAGQLRAAWVVSLVSLAVMAGCFSSTNGATVDAGDDGSGADVAVPGLDAGEDAPVIVDAPSDGSPSMDATVDASPEASPADDAAGASADSGAPDATAEAATSDAAPIVPGSYTINGAITGQTGSLVLQDDGQDSLTVSASAHAFHFPTGLAAGESYAVTVLTQPANQSCVVRGGTGSVGDASVGNVVVACAIAPPSDLAVTAGPESVTLTWTAVPGASSYNLYDGLASSLGQVTLGSPTSYGLPTTGTTTLSATVTGLAAGENYFFFLTSVDSQSHESLTGSNVVQATMVPLPPAVVTATAGNGQATLTWNSVQNATSYDVYYATTTNVAGGTKITGAVSGVPVTSLTNGQLYYFRVSALVATTEGPMSNEVSATPAAALHASIANLTNLGVVHSGVVVGRASGTGITAVQVSLDGGPYAAATGTATWSYALPAGASTWHDGSLHTISARATDGSMFSAIATVSVRKGVNQDVNGDGYADLAFGDPATGAAYVFESAGPTGIASAATSAASLTFTGTDANFGATVTLGDLNSDGYADVAVGEGCGYGVRNVYVFQSVVAPLTAATQAAAATALPGTDGSCFGSALAVGDVDGDGYGDLVVGAEGYTNPVGNAYVFRSSASGIASNATATATLTGPTLACTPACPIDEFGAQVAVGDVNGDGYADVAVSALQAGGIDDQTGAVYIFDSAGAAGIGTRTYAAANATVMGPAASGASSGSAGYGADFGATIAMGDLNGDGFADLVVGAPFMVSTNPSYWDYQLGAVYAFESAGAAGIASAAYSSAAVTLVTPLPTPLYCCSYVELGSSVAVGDLNGDGYADVVATSRLSPSMFVFQSQGSPIASADISGASTNLMATGSFFTQNAMADFNGDGFADIATVSQSTVYVYESVGASSPMPNGDLGYANTVVTVQNQSIALSR